MRTTLATVVGLAVIGLVQLPATGTAAAECGPPPIPCVATNSAEGTAHFLTLLGQMLFSGSA
ncbi:hypothetical protein [Nocardia asteroides]